MMPSLEENFAEQDGTSRTTFQWLILDSRGRLVLLKGTRARKRRRRHFEREASSKSSETSISKYKTNKTAKLGEGHREGEIWTDGRECMAMKTFTLSALDSIAITNNLPFSCECDVRSTLNKKKFVVAPWNSNTTCG